MGATFTEMTSGGRLRVRDDAINMQGGTVFLQVAVKKVVDTLDPDNAVSRCLGSALWCPIGALTLFDSSL
ncbi:hypothetical protein N7520_011354 [Penicillium odoratum]|uniref:uncharacterized protein n=1 Tax=Penicillium odoratum TaxID=1167516 RepID=UPI00254706A5|nr:uncharacterized protein N7520_011354 [Penicillium odoratum]KAJ5746172.1 hypothetical protein N7520_011354 [Penicillium odoratum]